MSILKKKRNIKVYLTDSRMTKVKEIEYIESDHNKNIYQIAIDKGFVIRVEVTK